MAIPQLQVGAPLANTPANQAIFQRGGGLGDTMLSKLQPDGYEALVRSQLFGGGIITALSISAASFTSATTGATATPIWGLYNPSGNTVTCYIWEIGIDFIVTATTATGPGGLVQMVTPVAGPISLGQVPYNMKSWTQTGSTCKCMNGVACTGMTGTLAVAMGAPGFGKLTLNTSLSPALGVTPPWVWRPSLISIPPNCVWGIFGTTTPVAVSATSYGIWSEMPTVV